MLDAKSATTLGRFVLTLKAFVAGLIEWVAGMKEIGYSSTRWNGRIVPSLPVD
jgi:hypothetical protein